MWMQKRNGGGEAKQREKGSPKGNREAKPGEKR